MQTYESKKEQNENNNVQEQNNINNNPINNQPPKPQINQTTQEILYQDELANLQYHDENNLNNNPYFKIPRLDSNGSPIAAQFKFSIDMPNVSKQRLHEFLNDDLLNALNESPNTTPIKSNEIKNSEQQIISNSNENNLVGFSLYPKINENIEQNKDINVQNQPNNNNNSNNTNMLNIEEPVYIPKNLRDINQVINTNTINNNNNNNNNNILNKEDLKQKNKFDVNKRHHNSMKYNNTNNKENNKNKKAFEVRLGDWTCSKCSNLNFAFRNKCNRCGMLKTVSEQQKMNIISQLNLNNYPMYMNMPPIINNNEQENF